MNDLMKLEKIFRALGNAKRLEIFNMIAEETALCQAGEGIGPCVTALAERTGVSQPTVSHHIKELVQAGLVNLVRKGQWVHCRVNPEAIDDVRNYLDYLSKEEVKA